MMSAGWCSLLSRRRGSDGSGPAGWRARRHISDGRAKFGSMRRCHKLPPDAPKSDIRTLHEAVSRARYDRDGTLVQRGPRRLYREATPRDWFLSETLALEARLLGRDATHRTRILDTHLTHVCIQHFRRFSRQRSGSARAVEPVKRCFAPLSGAADRRRGGEGR